MDYNGVEMPENGVIRNGVVFTTFDDGQEWWLCPDCSGSAGSKIAGIYHLVGNACSLKIPLV